eukprot:7860055-Prorocentrum_lima.AAC.1
MRTYKHYYSTHKDQATDPGYTYKAKTAKSNRTLTTTPPSQYDSTQTSLETTPHATYDQNITRATKRWT